MEQTIKKGFCVLLLILLIGPIIGLFFSTDNLKNCEKRKLADPPAFSFSTTWTHQLEAYYKDHFTLRNLTTHLNNSIKNNLFKSSSKPKVVCRGKEGWIFYNSDEDQMLDSYAHNNLWSEEVLIEKTKAWGIRKNDLAKQGIQYHMAVWPNKTTIYPEYMPSRMLQQIQNPDSKTDQIVEHLSSTNSPVALLDLRAKFLEKKTSEKLYHKHDSHWNALGAFYAYQAVIKSIGLQSLSLDDYHVKWQDEPSGDLKDLMGLCNLDKMKEAVPKLIPKAGLKTYIKQKTKLKNTAHYSSKDASTELSILIFNDSYIDAMIPFLAENFSQLYFINTDYNEKMVLVLHPDIVLVAKVERRL